MAARVHAAELAPLPSPPFASARCRNPGALSHRCRAFLVPHPTATTELSRTAASGVPCHAAIAQESLRVAARTPQRRPNRITCRAAVVHGSEGAKRRDPLRRGTVSPPLTVPDHIPRPPYVGTDTLPEVCADRQMHDSESLSRMRAACELAARVLQRAGALVKALVTTDEIDRAVHRMIVDAGAYPSPLGYGGFPKSVCTSVNECACHGIPDSRALQDGDIINIDVTVYLNGYHGDTSRTYLVGDVDESAKQLVKVTEECMMRGVSACKHGASFKEIGRRISEIAGKYGYSVDPFVGHGVGRIFHSEPIIWHTYDYEPGFMVAGQTFTIEPTLSLGSTQCVLWDDGWTAVSADGSLRAQFEHTVLVTADGAEILTKCCP